MPLVNRMHVLPGDRVLDIGCGTATLTMLIGDCMDAGCVVGMDIDPLFVGRHSLA